MALKMNARAVRERLKGKVEPDVLFVLEHLAENQSILYQQVIECAQLVDQISNIVTDFVGVATNMKSAIDAMQKYGPGEGDDAA